MNNQTKVENTVVPVKKKVEKIIGNLLITASVLLFIPYTILNIIFDYPDILRQDPSIILTKFHAGGIPLIVTWWLFAVVGLPLLGAAVLLGQKLENKFNYIRLATVIMVLGGIVQVIGLLRWSFVVPIISDAFVNTQNESIKEACIMAFKVIHQYGGVVLGEHLGQLFSIFWTIMIITAFKNLKLLPKWFINFGYIALSIYLLAQADLFATIIKNFPVWDAAGFIGSTLWLVCLLILGFKIRKMDLT